MLSFLLSIGLNVNMIWDFLLLLNMEGSLCWHIKLYLLMEVRIVNSMLRGTIHMEPLE